MDEKHIKTLIKEHFEMGKSMNAISPKINSMAEKIINVLKKKALYSGVVMVEVHLIVNT